jgi:hypothetical protein
VNVVELLCEFVRAMEGLSDLSGGVVLLWRLLGGEGGEGHGAEVKWGREREESSDDLRFSRRRRKDRKVDALK